MIHHCNSYFNGLWISKKSSSLNVSPSPAVARTIYISFFCIPINFKFDIDFNLALGEDLALDHALDYALAKTFVIDIDLDFAQSFARIFLNTSDQEDVRNHVQELFLALDRALVCTQDPTLEYQLQQLLSRLPNSSPGNQNFPQWWSSNGQQWREDLRQYMIVYCDIGHNWQLTEDKKRLLQQYYDANLLLVQCLNSDCYVSRDVRESIEETLLLPMEELRSENVELRK